jgi:hypothetical protein
MKKNMLMLSALLGVHAMTSGDASGIGSGAVTQASETYSATVPGLSETVQTPGYLPSLDATNLALAVKMAGTREGQKQLDGLVKAAAAQNPQGGIDNTELVKQKFIEWCLSVAAQGATQLAQVPVLGVALEHIADGIIHSPQAEKFLHTQLDVIISTVYRTLKNNSFFARILNWIGNR